MIRYLLILLLALTACSTQQKITSPFGQDDALPTASPEEVGMDANQLQDLSLRLAKKKKHKLHSLLVVRRGQVVFEEYYNGHTARAGSWLWAKRFRKQPAKI